MMTSFISVGPPQNISGMLPPGEIVIIDNASRLVDRYMSADENYKDLSELFKVESPNHPSVSGLHELDYPSQVDHKIGLGAMSEVSAVKKRQPLPTELVEQFEHMQCNCVMGLFPEISRAWISVDSDIFVWKYEDGGDLAYFDGLNETILCAGLVKPKPGIFQAHIQYLLCIATPVEVVLLGATFIPAQGIDPLFLDQQPDPAQCDMHLLGDPLFTLPTDGVYMMKLVGTENGRIFMCGKDGCLYELAYQAEDGWFSRKCRKINHTTSTLSFLLPAFLNFSFSDDDPMVQLSIDETRHVLYSRSEKGSIHVYDLGTDGWGTSRVASLSHQTVFNAASSLARTVDRSNFKSIVHIAAITKPESTSLHLVAVTHTGVRLYFTTCAFNDPFGRPSRLQLVHVRLPPGFTASASSEKPINIHQAHYHKGTLLMASALSSSSNYLWCIGSDTFPFQDQMMETYTTRAIDGHVWVLAEVPPGQPSRLRTNQNAPRNAFRRAEAPLVVRQHMEPIRSYVILTSQGAHLIDKYHPVHQLQQLLEMCKGPDSDDVKAFFALHKEQQACATCLVLACSKEANISPQMQDWATRAFFMYGGEPKHAYVNPISTLGPTAMQPTATSTPFHPSYAPSAPPNVTMYGNAGPGGAATYSAGFSTPAHAHGSMSHQMSAQGPAFTPSPGDHYSPGGQQSSTVAPWGVLNQSGAPMVTMDMSYSPKHDGICLYLSRILRPLWFTKVLSDTPFISPDGQKNFLCSRYTSHDLAWFIDHLSGLRDFIDSNTQITWPVLPDGMSFNALQSSRGRVHQDADDQLRRRPQAEAHTQEKVSLQQIQHLIHRAYEVLGLWQILCDHQFHLVAGGLNKEQQDRLKTVTFRSLINDDKEMCCTLITCLISRYLHDNATVDAVSSRLREICPSLYSNEDATCSKANEILKSVQGVTNRLERENMLRQALALFKQVTGHLDLAAVCNQLTSLRHFDGVVELCLAAAARRDPQQRALHFYNNGEPADDHEGCSAYLTRSDAYKCIFDTLRYLLSTSAAHPQAPNVPTSPGPPPQVDPNRITAAEAEQYSEQVLMLGLKSDDEVYHVALYEWLINMDLTDKLLEVKSPYLEAFLKRSATYRPDNLDMMDLLWKYYEKIRNYSAAAKILSKLAERRNGEITLQRRIEYLSRAIICAKSSSQRTASASDGEFLHDLEEKMEVTRLQLHVYDALQNWSADVPNVRDALQRLNSELLDISVLYGEFAEPFNLSECKLAIIHCANHYDPSLVEGLWRQIIDKELDCTVTLPAQSRMSSVYNKLVSLGRLYANTERYFPIAFLVKHLEKCGCQCGFEQNWVIRIMLSVGVKITVLQEIYDRMFKSQDKFWMANTPLHLLRVIYKLISELVENPALVPMHERRQFVSTCQDAILSYLVELQSMSSTDPAVTRLGAEYKGLQSRLDRLT